MAEYHLEEYIYLAGLTHKTAVIAWGGFFFKIQGHGADFKLVDDGDLDHVFPPRDETIGERSRPYGTAEVRVFDVASGALGGAAATSTHNHVVISNLRSDTEYRYELRVNGKQWAEAPLRDWGFDAAGRPGLRISTRRYDNRFRTLPHPTEPADATFAVLGDFGVGIRKPSQSGNRQREIAEALDAAIDGAKIRLLLTTGDNIYAQRKLGPLGIGGQGDEDDDWFFTYYQPYRYVINRVPVFPTLGNHDSGESEFENDDRVQAYDNFYIRTRFEPEQLVNRASLDPGLFYRFRFGRDVEFIALDSSKASIFAGSRFFMHDAHRPFLQAAFPKVQGADAPRWQIPFFHHPPYTAGPGHDNSASVIQHLLKAYFIPGRVRVVFCGHDHNFQATHADDIHCFVTGAAGKIDAERPKRSRFELAHVRAWGGTAHFLLAKIEGEQMSLRPVGSHAPGGLVDIPLEDIDGQRVPTPIAIPLRPQA